ncbi:MAG: hypothetical protein HC863_02375 [Myxococcales bacterium]|nr:hypothetical protein [Myxococcales bacterium]
MPHPFPGDAVEDLHGGDASKTPRTTRWQAWGFRDIRWRCGGELTAAGCARPVVSSSGDGFLTRARRSCQGARSSPQAAKTSAAAILVNYALAYPLQSSSRMRRFAALLFSSALLGLSACSLYFDEPTNPNQPPACDRTDATCDDGGGGDEPDPKVPPATFTFSKVRAIAGEYPVVGVDSDGAGGLWLAYRLAIGGYYDVDDVRVVHLDRDGRKLSEWRYLDEYTPVTGIAFGAGAVWLNYGATGTGNNHIRKLDPVDGHRLTSFAVEPGIIDLDARGDQLLLSNLWNQVIALDASTGGERWRTTLTSFASSTQRGIASTQDGKLWVATAVSNRILLLDDTHRVVDVGVTDQLDPQWNGIEGLQLAWDGSSLILAHDNQISWLARRGRAR